MRRLAVAAGSPWSPALIQGSFRKENRKVHDAGGDTVTMDRWHMAEAIRFVEAGRSRRKGKGRDVPLPTQSVRAVHTEQSSDDVI